MRYTVRMPIRTTHTLLTCHEAARRLGVSERRVNMLRESGDLASLSIEGLSLFTEESVHRQARWQGKAGRPYSPDMAFAALYLISGLDVPWISRQQRYRLGKYLGQVNAEDLVRLTRRRAAIHEFWCRDSLIGKVERLVRVSAATGDLAVLFQLTPTVVVEGYVASDQLDDVIRQCRLRQGDAPIRARLRAAGNLPDGEGPMPLGVCAADLAESGDPRERRAGLETLERLIHDYRSKEDQQ